MKKKRRKAGLGLLKERRQVLQDAAKADARKREPGRVPDPALQRAPDPVDFPAEVPKKRYQAPCFFSCTPDGWEPVDVYGTATIVHLAKAVAVASYTVPEGKVFRLAAVGNNWEAGAAGSLEFRVSVNGDPIGAGFGTFTYQMGDINVLDMYPVGLNVKGEGDTIVAIEVYNNHASTDYDAFARIKGYLGPDL